VPVALEVALELDAPLDLILVRKLGVPFQPELAMGAIGEGGTRVVDAEIVERAHVTEGQFASVEARERIELDRRADTYRPARLPVPIDGRVVIVVDDGIATGSTAEAACRVVRAKGARRVVLAVPVAPRDWAGRAAGIADETISVVSPRDFLAIGRFYRDFSQVSDEMVLSCLQRADRGQGEDGEPPAEPVI
jgi:putative phosphoribosyl transferase